MADIINSPVGTMPTIPVDSGGLFTPGAAYAIDSAAQIINSAWNLGLDKALDLDTKVASLATDIAGIITAGTTDISPSTATSLTITEPAVTIPTTIDTSTIVSTFDAVSDGLLTKFMTYVDGFITDYFPDDTADFTAARIWLTSALANPHGLPAAVAAQLYTDEHDRHVAEASRAKDSLAASFAARRFPMPPGALASAQLQIDQKAQDLSAETGRKITTMSVEQLKWAADKVLSLRQVAMAESLDCAKMLAIAPSTGATVTSLGYGEQAKLISAVSSYYNARTDAKKAMSAVEQFNMSQTQDAAVKNQIADLTLIEDKVKALMTNIQAVAQMATSLFNNVHASAGSSYGVNGT